MDVFAQLHSRKLELKLCFTTFSMKFRHAVGITHMNPSHDPLSDNSDPLLNLLATAVMCSID